MIKHIKYKRYLIILLAILPEIVLATTATQTSKDFSTVLKNIRGLIGPFMILILLICYIAGLGLIAKGLLMLKALAMPLTQMSRQGELGGPLVYIVVGSILVYMPVMTDISSSTLLGGASTIFSGNSVDLTAMGTAADELLSYGNSQGYNAQWLDFFNTLVLLIQFVGFLAFTRGWFIISKAGQPGVQPGVISRGIIHIVAGTIAINFVPMMTIVRNSIFGGTSGF